MPQPDRPGHVRQRQRRGDHHRSECGLREVAQQPGHEHEHEDDRRCPNESRDLGLGAGLLGDRRARAARAHRKALEQARADVGGADADHLCVPVHLLAGARGERRRRRDRVGKGNERDAERSGYQQRKVRDRARPREGREPLAAASLRARPRGRRDRAPPPRRSRPRPPPAPLGPAAASAGGPESPPG